MNMPTRVSALIFPSSMKRLSVARLPIHSTIKLTFDAGIIEAPHRGGLHQRIDRSCINLTVRIVGGVELDGHEPLGLVVADTPDEAASGHVGASELVEIQRPVIFDI